MLRSPPSVEHVFVAVIFASALEFSLKFTGDFTGDVEKLVLEFDR